MAAGRPLNRFEIFKVKMPDKSYRVIRTIGIQEDECLYPGSFGHQMCR